jgi:predicted deacylase
LRVLVSGGVHGDEPTGARVALEWVEHVLAHPSLRERVAFTVLPVVNPSGLANHQRKNAQGQDLNRAFPEGSIETSAIARSLRGDPFDLFLDLHGTLESGFMLIRGGDDRGMSARILRAMPAASLLGQAERATYTLHQLGGATSSNAGTFKQLMRDRGTPYAYTIEYPRRLPSEMQRRGLLRLLRAAVENVRVHGNYGVVPR